MKFALLLSFLLFSTEAIAQSNFERLSSIQNLKRIAFASCNYQDRPQPLWKDMIQQKPDLFIWDGDAIYADWGKDGMAKGYQIQSQQPDYKKLKSITPVIGTWDDHDYGKNNGDGRYSEKVQSQKFFLDFIEEPLNSLRRQQEGVYTSYEFGDPGKRIKIILLDDRYFKNLDPDYPMLGKKQWDWLEKELLTSDASLHLIANGISLLAPSFPHVEQWPKNEVERMLGLLERAKTKGPVLLTGDKHFSTIITRAGYLEFLSSGMTHLAPKETWPFLREVFHDPFFQFSYGQIDVNWDPELNPIITLSMRSTDGIDHQLSRFQWRDHSWVMDYTNK